MSNRLVYPSGKVPGLLPRRRKFGDVCALFREENEVIPREHWAELIPKQAGLRPHVHHIFDQQTKPSCAAESAVQALQIVRSVSGQRFELLNPWSVFFYTQIGDGGSTLDDNLEHLRIHGAAPMSIWPRSKGVSPLPENVKRVALNYRLDKSLDVDTVEELGTALIRGFGVPFGWKGHSCLFTRLLNDAGDCEYVNSWHKTWGDEGFGQLNFNEVYWGYGVFAYRTPIMFDA